MTRRAVYVLKVLACTGALVPHGGQHVEYRDVQRAERDALILYDVTREAIHVVDYGTDKTVRVIADL